MKKLISIITPFYNEEKNVEAFFQEVNSVIQNIPNYNFEIICIDDGSIDLTNSKLIELNQLDKRYKIVELSRNFGKEAALTAGIDEAQGDAVIPMDSDLQDPPLTIIKLICEWEKGFEVVLAKRSDRYNDTFAKRQSSMFFYKISNYLFSPKIPNNVGDFRLIDRTVVEAIKLLPERQRFMKGLFAWVGFKTTTVNFIRGKRDEGKTTFTPWKLWNFALDGITSFSITPLKIWMYIGFIGAIISGVYSLYIVLRTLISGIDVPGYASIIVAILFISSVQLISIGIIGEYIGRIYNETKHRPIYIIRKKYM